MSELFLGGGPSPRGTLTPTGTPEICWAFQKTGKCKFGRRCKYSHDVPGKGTNWGPRRGGQQLPAARQQGTHDNQYSVSGKNEVPACTPQLSGIGKLREWKRLLQQGSQIARPSPTVLSRFFQLGLELMDGDVGAAQEAIKLFATDTGLSFIKDITDWNVPQQVNTIGPILWTTQIRPLFQLITHPLVVNSSVLEQQVAVLFNFLYGVGGDRMTRLFSFIIKLVQSWPSRDSEPSRVAAIELSLSVLSKVLDCNTANIVNDKFAKLTSDFTKCLETECRPEEEFSRLQGTKYLDYIRLRLDIGDEIAALRNPSKIPVTREKFTLRRDLPGALSAEGRRHDNDHASIVDIKILPTYEEIISPRAEYLPTTDPSQWHIQGIRGRLDREFRLLREDTVGQLRDAVRDTLESIRARQNPGAHRPQNGARTYTYSFPTPVAIEVDRDGRLELVIRCNQLDNVRQLSTKKRREWWMQSKRLQSGALVCVVDATGSVLFCVVSDTTMRTAADKKDQRRWKDDNDPEPETGSVPLTLSEDQDFLFLKLQLVDPGKKEIRQALCWYRTVGSSPSRHLVEFPGVLLASFKDTLEALQQIYRQPNVPFSDLIAPQSDPSGSLVESQTVPPPQYTRAMEFSYDLSCLTLSDVKLSVNPRAPPSPQQVATQTTLDATQSAALLNTLCRGLSLIQGPPGTGKSYTGEKIIKVLLQNKKKARLGPVLCVCYTNHALDQLLEHLLDDQIDKVIRIGSRSKSERLQDLNLRAVVGSFERTKAEKRTLWELEGSIRSYVKETKGLLTQLSDVGSQRSIKMFLADNYPSQHNELFKSIDDGWETVDYHQDKTVDRWLYEAPIGQSRPRSIETLTRVSLGTMTQEERKLLHRHWVRSIRDKIITEVIQTHEELTEAIDERYRLRQDVDLRCLQQADIVGVTTTGLARNLHLLRKLQCKVMLCEEAGEVLEAHILTALLPSVEHAILIGDHLQLRPQIQNYELQSTNPRGKQYSLDMSLFERLVEPPHETDIKLPYSILETQRRMHPSIAELVRSTLYPSLKDAERVSKYPDVVGMKKRLFWFHHQNPEIGAESHDALSTSHSNSFEVEMTAALVSHLVRQGEYAKSDIAVITPYLGQLQRLRQRMETMFEICLNDRDQEQVDALEADGLGQPPLTLRTQLGKTTLAKSIRIATVDNFQGEEAKVIVVSLVRSNPQKNCGFLRTSNRINVLLSRAQHGMYIIGDASTYQSIPMWAQVIKNLGENGNIGTRLELQCARHPNTPLPVSQPDHFLIFSPESGCTLPCEKRLHCGHSCTGKCHSDVLHNAVKCLEACPRSKVGCDHPCPLRCGDACDKKCQTILNDLSLQLPCGHILTTARCWEAQDPASIRCKVTVTRQVPGCNHSVWVPCHQDVDGPTYRCTASCGHNRECGHQCQKPCYTCNTRTDGEITVSKHGTCTQRCGRNYSTCRHTCAKMCHDGSTCPPCSAPCEVRCGHSRCSKTCHEPCSPCAEPTCHSSCPHASCSMPCAAPCDWVPCSRRCEKLLGCGHQCPSLCSEACPDGRYCQVCASDGIKSACVDFLEMKEYHEIDLNEEPCVFPDCGHFLTVASMDGQMGMAAHYELDSKGHPAMIFRASEPFSTGTEAVKVCPTCRGSLRNISRYGRIVRRGMLDEATKKFVSWSNIQYLKLAQAVVKEQENLINQVLIKATTSSNEPAKQLFTTPRMGHLRQLQQLAGNGTRYNTMLNLWNLVSAFQRQVRKEEQPFHKVAEFVQHANRHKTTKNAFKFDESVIQVRGSLLATVLLLKCEIAIFTDFFRLQSLGKLGTGVSPADIRIAWSIYIKDCMELIRSAQKATLPREEVQGHVFAAQFLTFSRRFSPASIKQEDAGDKEESSGKDEALEHIKQAWILFHKYPSTQVLKNEIEAVEHMINDGVFYSQVTTEEMQAVYHAMSTEFRGTGHWYRCENNHPFTVGECGAPMELARCPECNAPVGGVNHAPAAGVNRASDIEELQGGIRGMQI